MRAALSARRSLKIPNRRPRALAQSHLHAATCPSPPAVPFFVEEVKNSDWFASVQQPTRIVSWAKESLPDEMRARIPPAASTVETDDRYAGAVILFLFAICAWVLSSTIGIAPLLIVSVVVGFYYTIPALMSV